MPGFVLFRKTTIRSKRALAYSIASRTVNTVETEKMQLRRMSRASKKVRTSESGLYPFAIRRPLMNHQYVLLYEPD